LGITLALEELALETKNFRFYGGIKLSFPKDRYCPLEDCKYNRHPVKADAAQIKEHLGYHGYENLLITTKALNLIEDYARPKWEELVEILADNSLIRSLPNA